MNVAAMIKRLGGKEYTVTRASADGSYDDSNGSFVPGATETLSVLGLVQPMTPDELVSIPEGDRTRERFRFYCATALKQIDTSTGRPADTVDLDGVPYDVDNVEHWPNHGKVIIVRKNTDGN
jgi:hypothetical protein